MGSRFAHLLNFIAYKELKKRLLKVSIQNSNSFLKIRENTDVNFFIIQQHGQNKGYLFYIFITTTKLIFSICLLLLIRIENVEPSAGCPR